MKRIAATAAVTIAMGLGLAACNDSGDSMDSSEKMAPASTSGAMMTEEKMSQETMQPSEAMDKMDGEEHSGEAMTEQMEKSN
ncbi:hypothetical protein H7347_08855 [Corynebacterium sp. zg-331]|uniref:hypothetical protein n=1 Tax=unclassified Corynebacterium TaxID=2624378 RepID=UPI00128C79CF|nr:MULTISPECIES: hypothetical protein [unclassified Corynebacterium]MBC3186669.1 hypothetical protein [Corynebacterium sp. zg-331]MPV53153.1 hypothetical protein [Corynebacterium sp. zg331]